MEGDHAPYNCKNCFQKSTDRRISWARLLKHVFDVDVEHCPNCGGALKIIAAIDDPPVIVKILSHLGLPTRGQGQLERWLGGLRAVHCAAVGLGVGD